MEHHPKLFIIFLVAESIALVSSVFGNGVVCYVMIFKKNLSKPSMKYILSTTIANLLAGLIAIPIGILKAFGGQPHNYELCVATTAVAFTIFTISLSTLLPLSIDRFWSICFTTTYPKIETPKVVNTIIIASWLLPVALGTMIVLTAKSCDNFIKNENKCSITAIVSSNILMIQFAISVTGVVLMIISYVLIFLKVQRKKRKQLEQNAHTFVTKRVEMRITMTFAMIIGAYIVCWTPVQVTFVTVALTTPSFFSQPWYRKFLYYSAICAAHFNSAVNPFIYAYRIKDIRDTMKKVLGCNKRTEANQGSAQQSSRH